MISSKGPRRCAGNFSGSNGGLTELATVALSVVVASRGCRYGAIEIAEIGLRSAMTRLGDIEGKLLAAAEIERLARRKGRRQ
jgi:hypothetical protein